MDFDETEYVPGWVVNNANAAYDKVAAENARLRAALDTVRALCDEARQQTSPFVPPGLVRAADIRTALDTAGAPIP